MRATRASATDLWLKRWLPLVAAHAGGQPVLELGCGGGRDTATLVEAGHHVVAVELSADAVGRARARVPSAAIHCQDIRAPFPVSDGSVGVVVASLSLHYFSWAETSNLAERVRQVLRPSGHPLIAEDHYLVDGGPKRFFDRAAVDRLFASGWSALGIEERMIDRYDHPKAVWEAVLLRND